MKRRQLLRTLAQGGAALALPALPVLGRAQEAIGAKSVTIGSSVGVTGPLASLGRELQWGLEAAVAQANAKGGVHGREIHLQVLDDGYAPARTQDNVRKLLADGGVAALLSCMGTANNTAILPLVEESNIPYVAPQSGAVSLRRASLRSVFHVRASYTDESQRLVQKLVGMGIGNLAVIHHETAYGKEFLGDVGRALQAAGVGQFQQFGLDAEGRKVAEVVEQALAARPGAILLGTAGDASAALVAQIRKLSPSLPLAGSSVTLSGDNLRQLGARSSGLALTMVLPDANRTSVPLVRDYQKAMRAYGQSDFSSRSLEGYVNARVLLEGLERSGRELSRSKLRNALAGIRAHDLGGLTIDYASAGNGPYVGSRYIDLGVLGAGGRFLG